MPFGKQNKAPNSPSKRSNISPTSKTPNLNPASLPNNNSGRPKLQSGVKIVVNPSRKALQQSENPSTSKPFRCLFFERLPGEIRQEIYKYAVGYTFVAEKSFHFWTWNEIDIENDIQYTNLPRDLPISHYGHDYQATEELWGGSNRDALWPLDICLEVRLRIHHVIRTGKRFKSDPETIIVYHGKSQYQTVLGQETRHAGTSMLFVCRLMYQEVVKLIYSRVTFGLASPHAIHKKLFRYHDHQNRENSNEQNLPKSLRDPPFRFIQSLCLECPAYNTPKGYEATPLRKLGLEQRYYRGWRMTCIELASKLTNLKRLRLFISLPGRSDLLIGANTLWAAAFLEFGACKTLREVEVWLGGCENDRQELCCEVLAEILRRKILGWDDLSAFHAVTEAINSSTIHQRLYAASEYISALNKMVLSDPHLGDLSADEANFYDAA